MVYPFLSRIVCVFHVYRLRPSSIGLRDGDVITNILGGRPKTKKEFAAMFVKSGMQAGDKMPMLATRGKKLVLVNVEIGAIGVSQQEVRKVKRLSEGAIMKADMESL